MIPKIIHQIWFQDTYNKYTINKQKLPFEQSIVDKQQNIMNSLTPYKYKIYQLEWVMLNKRWHYVLWNEKSLYEFINDNYPLLLETYRLLTNKNKIKMAKYLLVYHFGGIYIDIYVKCLKPLDKLIVLHNNKNLLFSEIPYTTKFERSVIDVIYSYKKWYTLISNSVILSSPFHPLVKDILEQITWGVNSGKINHHNFIEKMVTILVNENITKHKDSIILQNYYLDPCYMYDKKCKHIPLSFTTRYNSNNKIKNICMKLTSYIYFGYMRNTTKIVLFVLILYIFKLTYNIYFY